MHWKWILVIAATLIVALIGTFLVVLWRYDFNKFKPKIVQMVKDATGRELNLGGDLELKMGLTPALRVEDVSFQNAQWGSRAELAKVKCFEAQVALLPLIAGKIDIKRLILLEPDILIETSNSGRSNLEFQISKSVEPAKEKKQAQAIELKPEAFRFGKLKIRKGRLTYKSRKSTETYTVTIDSLTAAAASMDDKIEVEFRGAYKNELIEIVGTLGPLTALTDPYKTWSVNLTANAGGSTVTLRGAVRDLMNFRSLELSVKAEGSSINDILKMVDVTGIPDMGPFRFAMKVVDISAKTYKVSGVKLDVGESDLAGSAEVRLANKRPRVLAVLSSKKVDLRPLLAKGEGTGGTARNAPRKAERERVFPNKLLPLNVLKQTDAEVKIRAGKVLLPLLALSDLKLEMVLEEGGLRVEPLNALIGGGTMDGRFELDLKDKVPALSTAVKITQLDLARMLKELKTKDIVEGEVDIYVELMGKGNSIAALMAGLNGRTILVMGEGRIKKNYIDLLGSDLSSNLLRLLNPFKGEVDYTDITCFVSRFDIKNGVADTTALVLDTSQMSLVGHGEVNLKSEELDISLRPSPKKGIGVKSIGKLSLSLAELTKPFKLSGTLANPSLAIDPRKTAITFGKALGGVILFGPAGIAAALAGGSSGEENACLSAIESAKQGVMVSGGKKPEEKKGVIEKATEGVGGALKKLFSR